MPKEGGSKTKTLKQNCTKGDRSCVLGDFARFIVIWKQISQVKQIGNWDSALKFGKSQNEMSEVLLLMLKDETFTLSRS